MINKVRRLLFKRTKKMPKETPTEPKLSPEDARKQQALIELRQLYELLLAIDKTLPNRKAKKQFWLKFAKDGKVRKELFLRLLESYK